MFKKTTCPECGARWNEGVYDKCPNCGWVVGTEPTHKSIKESEKTPDEQKPTEISKPDNKYDVNPSAEQIVNMILKVWLVLGWVVSIVFAVGICGYLMEDVFDNVILSLVVGLIAGAINLLVVYLIWALGKLFVNISQNLFILNEKIK